MEALLVDEIPRGPGWQYEPKWDGFRCLAFRDGRRSTCNRRRRSRLVGISPKSWRRCDKSRRARFVLDGEIVVPVHGHLAFDELLQRIHPAQSRIEKLSREWPALLIVFDLLADTRGAKLVKLPLSERRRAWRRSPSAYLARGASCAFRRRRHAWRRPRNGFRSWGAIWTAWSPNCWTRRIGRVSGRRCKRSSSCARPIALSAVFAMAATSIW